MFAQGLGEISQESRVRLNNLKNVIASRKTEIVKLSEMNIGLVRDLTQAKELLLRNQELLNTLWEELEALV